MTRKTTTTPESRRAQGRLGAQVRALGSDHPETQAARQEWRSEAYMAAVKAAVADAPPLTAEQRARLSATLRPVLRAAAGSEVAA